MAKDRYPLAPAHGARQRTELVRRGELTAAIGDARLAEERLASSRERSAAARQQLAQAVVARQRLASADAAELARHERFIARCRREVEAAISAEHRAQEAHDRHASGVDLARSTLARARAEREVIERHFARWREAQRKLAERRED